MPVLVIAYWAYSFINIYKSSIYVPAKRLVMLVIGFLTLLVISVVSFILFSLFNIFDVTQSLAVSMMLGSIATYLFTTIDLRYKFKTWFFNSQMLVAFLLACLMLFVYSQQLQVSNKLFLFVLYFGLQMYLMLEWKVIRIPTRNPSSPI